MTVKEAIDRIMRYDTHQWVYEVAFDETAEHVRASFWRRRIILLKPKQLDELTGVGWRNVYRYEAGLNSKGDGPVPPHVWQRYKMACAGLHAQKYGWTKGRQFDWGL